MNNKISTIFGSSFLIAGFLYVIYSRYQLKNNFMFTTARVYDVQVSAYKNYGDYSIEYEFYVDGKRFDNHNNYKYCGELSLIKLKKLLIDKKLPLAYPVKAYSLGVSKLLINREDALEFNYALPDSILIYDSILTCKIRPN